jgi:hypothetical protein
MTSMGEGIRRAARVAAAFARAAVWVLGTRAEYGQGDVRAVSW